MRDFKDGVEKLLIDAADFDFVGNLATDEIKRASFRCLAEQFRTIAKKLEAESDGTGPVPPDSVLLEHANEFRELAAGSHQENIRTGLLRMAYEYEQLAAGDAAI